MKTTDWRWNGKALGVPVRRHGNWHIVLLRNWIVFTTAESPRWWLRLCWFHIAWWPKDKRRLEVGWHKP
jgi:hypothetical protein